MSGCRFTKIGDKRRESDDVEYWYCTSYNINFGTAIISALLRRTVVNRVEKSEACARSAEKMDACLSPFV